MFCRQVSTSPSVLLYHMILFEVPRCPWLNEATQETNAVLNIFRVCHTCCFVICDFAVELSYLGRGNGLFLFHKVEWRCPKWNPQVGPLTIKKNTRRSPVCANAHTAQEILTPPRWMRLKTSAICPVTVLRVADPVVGQRAGRVEHESPTVRQDSRMETGDHATAHWSLGGGGHVPLSQSVTFLKTGHPPSIIDSLSDPWVANISQA